MRSILARYDATGALDKRIAELDPTAAGAKLSPMHMRTVEVLTDLLSMADSATDDDTPPVLRTLLSVVRRSRPMLVDLVRKVPESAIVATMTKLRDDIQSVIDTAARQHTVDAAAVPITDAHPPVIEVSEPESCHYLEGEHHPCIYLEEDGSCGHCGAEGGEHDGAGAAAGATG